MPKTWSLPLFLILCLVLPFSIQTRILNEEIQPHYPSNPRLQAAYSALQAWKSVFRSDPYNLTTNWNGPDVCSYTGIFCAPAIDDPKIVTVAGIDLNHGGILGILHESLGCLTDIAVLHLNSNRFGGSIPTSFGQLSHLYELDVSNNILAGGFPSVLLDLPALRYLDLRFNGFSGNVPAKLFDLPLDALFINDNAFSFDLPDNIGNSSVSVMVLSNNSISGQLPISISKMAPTLNELIITNTNLESCIPPAMGCLENLVVLDLSSNKLVGPLPTLIGDLENIEQLNLAHNMLSGEMPDNLCATKNLMNFTYADNFFYGAAPEGCNTIQSSDGSQNCFEEVDSQRSPKECLEFLLRPVKCNV